MPNKTNSKTIKNNVEQIFLQHEKARSNDKLLMLLYWKNIDKIDMTSESSFVERATTPESIRRARQLIQEEGLLLPSEDVVARRRGRQKAMRNAIVQERRVV